MLSTLVRPSYRVVGQSYSTVVSQPRGFFRGSLLGFLLGFGSAGSAGYVFLYQDYEKSNFTLLSSMESLQHSTLKLKQDAGEIQAVKDRLARMEQQLASQQQLEQVRLELLKAIDQVDVSQLETKTKVWELLKQ